MQKRLACCHLEVNQKKIRLIEFGRFAAQNRRARGKGKPETFHFLGFTHICGKTQTGKFCVIRKSQRKKLIVKLKDLAVELRQRIVQPLEEVGAWLRKVVQGHYQYYGVPRNSASFHWFRDQLTYLWKKQLSRRSHKGYVNWDKMRTIANEWLPRPRIVHPYPGSC